MARTPPARTAGQRPLIALVAVIVLGVGTTSVLTAAEEPTGAPAAGGDGEAVSSPEPGRTESVVGPATGADVADYIEERRAALADAAETVDTAVVSFTRTLRTEDALALVQDAGQVEVRAVLLRLPLELAAPETVRVEPEEDPVAAVREVLDQQAAPLEEERARTQELLDSGTVGDEEFEAEYERRVEELTAALGAVEEGDVVHALVVRAPLAALRQLDGATAVRLVDPAPPGTDAGLSTFFGLLPGDEETVSSGRAA